MVITIPKMSLHLMVLVHHQAQWQWGKLMLTNLSAFFSWMSRKLAWASGILCRTYKGHLFWGECFKNLVCHTPVMIRKVCWFWQFFCGILSDKTLLQPYISHMCWHLALTHWGQGKITTISQTTFSNAFSWMKIYVCCLRFCWNMHLRFVLIISQHWFR